MPKLSLPIALIILWMLLSGMLKPLLLILGLLSLLLVLWVDHRMHGSRRLRITLAPLPTLGYLLWLLKEIVLSALDVSRRIIHPDLPISPTFVRVQSTQRSALGQTIFANSITLTPGTLSVDLENGEVLVHAVSREGAEALLDGEMDRRVSALEAQAHHEGSDHV